MNKEKIIEIFENDPNVSWVINKAFDFAKIVTKTLFIYGFLFCIVFVYIIYDMFFRSPEVKYPTIKKDLHLVEVNNECWEAMIENGDTVLINYLITKGKYR